MIITKCDRCRKVIDTPAYALGMFPMIFPNANEKHSTKETRGYGPGEYEADVIKAKIEFNSEREAGACLM